MIELFCFQTVDMRSPVYLCVSEWRREMFQWNKYVLNYINWIDMQQINTQKKNEPSKAQEKPKTENNVKSLVYASHMELCAAQNKCIECAQDRESNRIESNGRVHKLDLLSARIHCCGIVTMNSKRSATALLVYHVVTLFPLRRTHRIDGMQCATYTK